MDLDGLLLPPYLSLSLLPPLQRCLEVSPALLHRCRRHRHRRSDLVAAVSYTPSYGERLFSLAIGCYAWRFSSLILTYNNQLA